MNIGEKKQLEVSRDEARDLSELTKNETTAEIQIEQQIGKKTLKKLGHMKYICVQSIQNLPS